MSTSPQATPTTVASCCIPVLEGRLSAEDAAPLAAAFKVLADPARLRLLSLIATRPGGQACNCELVEPLGLSQPTVSHHLKVLHDAGFLHREKRAQWVYYRIAPERLAQLRTALEPATPIDGRPGGTTSVEPPIACTLDPGAIDQRVREWREVAGQARDCQPVPGGIRLEFAEDAPVEAIARLAVAEQACCEFFSFALTMDSHGVALEVRTPREAQPVLAALFGGPT